MIGTFFMKYRFPLAYAATKVLANHIHAAMVGRPVQPRKCRVSYQVIHKTRSAKPIDLTSSPLPRARKTTKWISVKSYSAATKQNGGLRGSSATKWKR